MVVGGEIKIQKLERRKLYKKMGKTPEERLAPPSSMLATNPFPVPEMFLIDYC